MKKSVVENILNWDLPLESNIEIIVVQNRQEALMLSKNQILSPTHIFNKYVNNMSEKQAKSGVWGLIQQKRYVQDNNKVVEHKNEKSIVTVV